MPGFLQQLRPSLWSTIVTLFAIALFLKLGFWQLSRAEEKDNRFFLLEHYAQQPPVTIPQSLVKLDDYLYRRVEVEGYFAPRQSIFLDNKIHQGIAGYHILTPLRLVNSSVYIVVNRGWVAGGNDRSILPDVYTPTELVHLVGIVASPSIKALSLSDNNIAGKVWQNFDLDSYKNMTGLTFQPLLLLQQNDVIDDGLVREWEALDSGSSRNTGYAFQWFSFAALTFILYIVLNVKQKNNA
jgi:surfeit locus 1 family protein